MAPSADWDEIKRLAADFQKAQLSSSVQRLSERNCIEIVTKLIELKLIDVIFTTDGKEYLTSQQLLREIKDELFVHGGRINTVELAKELNVNLNQITTHVAEITKGKEIQLVSGYLISHYYLEKIAREINEKLQLHGQISVGELTLQYDLPAELLQHKVLEKNLGKIVMAKQDTSDPRIFYTEEYIRRNKAKIRGALIALLTPTPVAVIINHCNLSERLFISLFDEINAPGILTGRHSGAQYIPACFTESQTNWVTNFYKQNNYLEFDALTRLGISNPKSFVKKTYPNEEFMFLNSCAIGSQIKQQLEMALEECISLRSYLDISTLVPSIFSDADIEAVIDILQDKISNSTVVFESTVFSNLYIEDLKKTCMPMVSKKSENVVKSGEYQHYYLEKQISKADVQQSHVDHKTERREERRKKASSGKGGGGTQGRETKTKAVKKHNRGKHVVLDSDSEDEVVTKKNQGQMEIVTMDDIANEIKKELECEGLSDLLTFIAEFIHRPLNNTALSIAKEAANKLHQDASQNRKQTHSASQEKINLLVNDIKLYEKGLKLFPADQQPQFVKYLLKSLGTDVLNEFCKYAAGQCNLTVKDQLTTEQRNKLINDLSEEYTKPFKTLNATLAEQNLDAFYDAVDEALAVCGMILKKVDKKKDKILIQNHRQKLIMELEACDDPALVLHLAVLAMFTLLTQNMIHASGRQVPLIVQHLKTHLKEEDFEQLQVFHELVTKFLTGTEEEKSNATNILMMEMPTIKKIVTSIKK